MSKRDGSDEFDYAEYIESALCTEGGHLSIDRGGFTIHYARGATLSGYDCDHVKACCIAAGLPVIDSRTVPFDDVVRLAVRGPMPAVGEDPSPKPWHAFSYVPLAVLAEAYRDAGAEVFNIAAPADAASLRE
ncbi:hypothetical protein [Rhodoplanes sp. SY1]|uniref:hypothetical protein n=1 Tax=Rhodoplanes sp. SY1 TaxID=3166646 RepID=UPI0038B5983C